MNDNGQLLNPTQYKLNQFLMWVIPCEITHSKNESLPIVFILSTKSVHPMRFHNPEYQPPVTSGSTGTSETRQKKNQQKIYKQRSYVQLKLAGFFVHPVTLEPEVTRG